jgi:hypothetical protein
MMQLVSACSKGSAPMDWHLEEQWDAIGKAVHIEAGLEVPPAQADGRLHNEGMTFQHPDGSCARSVQDRSVTLAAFNHNIRADD